MWTLRARRPFDFATMLAVFSVFLLIALDLSDTLPSKKCKVPNADAGTCTLLASCKPLLDIQKKTHKTELEKTFFSQSAALCSQGFKTKVCCPPQEQWSKLTINPVIYEEVPIGPIIARPIGLAINSNVDDSLNSDVENRISSGEIQPAIGQLNETGADNQLLDWLSHWDNSGQKPGTCGADVSSNHRIVGGSYTAIDEYPWLALLEYGPNDFRCGGSLISTKHVLTAAHCLYTKPVRVRLAEYNLTTFPTDMVETDGGGFENITVTVVDVDWVVRHPDHEIGTSIKDIGIVKLKSAVKFTEFIKPICLPTMNYRANFNSIDTNFTVAGWGADNVTIRSDVKRHVVVPYMEVNECANRNTLSRNFILREQPICAGGEKGKDSCKGDSGGPLMYEADKSWVLVGIVSAGFAICGTVGQPAIYTHVYDHMDWINKMMFRT